MSNGTGERGRDGGRGPARARGRTSTGPGRALAAAALLAALLAAPGVAAAQARVTATLDAEEIALDETVTLTVVVQSSDAPQDLQFPKDMPFSVLGRSQSSGSSFSLGGGAGVQISRTLTLVLQLAPRQAGRLTIGPIAAIVAGRRYASEPVTINVLPEGQRPKPQPGPSQSQRVPAPPGVRGGGAWRGWERDLRLAVEADRTEVWLGEQVVVSAWFVSPVPIVNVENWKEPQFVGFWKELLDSPHRLEEQVRVIDGVPLRTYLVSRFALVPTRSGELTIDPYQALVKVQAGVNSPFDPFPDLRSARLKSQPITVKVRPLPAGAPPGFASVNVGTLSLEASASDAAVPAGQPVTIRVTAKGDGNVRALALPPVPELPGTRRFEPTQAEKVTTKGGRLGGSRTVETVVVPEREGELVVPALSWPVFDPARGAYQTLRTEPIRISVSPAGATAAQTPIAGANALGAGLRPIRADGSDLTRASPPPWRSPFFVAALALPVLGFAGLGLGLRLREHQAAGAGARRTRLAGRNARRRLAAARRALARNDRESFFAEVERALTGYCADRLRIPVGALTREALGRTLGGAGAHGPAVQALDDALGACDAARYGRAGAGAEEALLGQAERAIALLDEADWSPGRAA